MALPNPRPPPVTMAVRPFNEYLEMSNMIKPPKNHHISWNIRSTALSACHHLVLTANPGIFAGPS
jgi:hypothetical protein